MFKCRQKINFFLTIFLEVFQRHCKFFIQGTLAKSGYAHLKLYDNLVENFHTYLQAKNKLYSPGFSGDIAKTSKLLILGTSGMTGYALPKWQTQNEKTSMFHRTPKINFTINFVIPRYGMDGETSITILLFILDYLHKPF